MHVYVIVSGLRAQATIIAEAQVLLCSQYKKNNPQCDPIQYAQSILMLFYSQDRLIPNNITTIPMDCPNPFKL